jgi:hypothetical protein
VGVVPVWQVSFGVSVLGFMPPSVSEQWMQTRAVRLGNAVSTPLKRTRIECLMRAWRSSPIPFPNALMSLVCAVVCVQCDT